MTLQTAYGAAAVVGIGRRVVLGVGRVCAVASTKTGAQQPSSVLAEELYSKYAESMLLQPRLWRNCRRRYWPERCIEVRRIRAAFELSERGSIADLHFETRLVEP